MRSSSTPAVLAELSRAYVAALSSPGAEAPGLLNATASYNKAVWSLAVDAESASGVTDLAVGIVLSAVLFSLLAVVLRLLALGAWAASGGAQAACSHAFVAGFGLSAAAAWALLGLAVVGCFVLLILVRITVPRVKLETLSRLGWGTLLGLLGAALLVYLVGAGLF